MNAQDIKFELATKIYYGKDSHCRCGCGGNYAKPGTPMFNRYEQAIMKLKQDFEQEDKNWINISLPDNKAYTVYFN